MSHIFNYKGQQSYVQHQHKYVRRGRAENCTAAQLVTARPKFVGINIFIHRTFRPAEASSPRVAWQRSRSTVLNTMKCTRHVCLYSPGAQPADKEESVQIRSRHAIQHQLTVLFSMMLRTVSRMYSLMRGSSLRRSSGFGAFVR